MVTHPNHKQVGQHRNTDRFLAPILVPTDLVLVQPQPGFKFPGHQLDRPAFLVRAHHLARRQLGQIGHQDFRLLGAHVPPLFAQHHGDFTDMTQTQAGVIRPKSPTAFLGVSLGTRVRW